MQNLSQIGQKVKNFDLKHGRDDIIKMFYVFERFCARVSSCNFGLQINEKHGRGKGDFLFFALYFTKIAQPEQG